MAAMPRLSGDRCQCSPTTGGCGELFNSTYAFDQHRTGEHGVGRRCLTVPEMEARGFVRNATGYWITKASPMARGRGGNPESAAIAPRPVPEGRSRPDGA
jgi:hypothetical protein